MIDNSCYKERHALNRIQGIQTSARQDAPTTSSPEFRVWQLLPQKGEILTHNGFLNFK